MLAAELKDAGQGRDNEGIRLRSNLAVLRTEYLEIPSASRDHESTD